ncbi:hypothetical protein KAU33_11915 [Candidatus Dependentiae bacterium]|nr:hypothetical protein [Candidatus Dependentiae bacterium]
MIMNLCKYFFLKYIRVNKIFAVFFIILVYNILMISFLTMGGGIKGIIHQIVGTNNFFIFLTILILTAGFLNKDIEDKSADMIFISSIKRYQYVIVSYLMSALSIFLMFFLVFLADILVIFIVFKKFEINFLYFPVLSIFIILFWNAISMFFSTNSKKNANVAGTIGYYFLTLILYHTFYIKTIETKVHGIYYLVSLIKNIISPFMVVVEIENQIESLNTIPAWMYLNFLLVIFFFVYMSIKIFNKREIGVR